MQASAKALVAIFIVLMIALSSTRVLDDYVDDYTDTALRNAALTYATARGLNALVSMMQSSEIEAGVGVVSGSITVGELLDPVNDMLERFSTVMTWALASLAAQKVLLLVASHEVFLYLVAALGLAALLTMLYASPRIRSVAFRIFLVVVFVRFSLGLAVALNSGADYLFLERQVEANNAEIEKFQSRVIGIDGSEELDGESIRNSAIRFWRGLSLDELERRVSTGIENFINLVALFLLKTILFPLAFFYIAWYLVGFLWRLDLGADRESPSGSHRGNP
jgi:hypothetical protein